MLSLAENFNAQSQIIIMCPPTYLTLPENGSNEKSRKYGKEFAADPQGYQHKAVNQWTPLRDTYRQDDLHVVELQPSADRKSQVFTADPAFTLLDHKKKELIVLKSRFTHAKRQAESEPFVEALHQLTSEGGPLEGYTIREEKIENNFEGTGDIYYDTYRDLIIAGYTKAPDPERPQDGRSNVLAHPEIEKATGVEVLSIEVVNPCFHIDTCLTPLPSGHMLVFKDGMTEASYNDLIQRCFIDEGLDPEEYLIPVSENDALNNYVTNLSCVGKTIYMPEADGEEYPPVDSDLIQQLEDIGYNVKVIPYSQMIKAGGAFHCSSHLIAARERQVEFVLEEAAL